jgi:hypothetical protein
MGTFYSLLVRGIKMVVVSSFGILEKALSKYIILKFLRPIEEKEKNQDVFSLALTS